MVSTNHVLFACFNAAVYRVKYSKGSLQPGGHKRQFHSRVLDIKEIIETLMQEALKSN